jgi:hypothetical protein
VAARRHGLIRDEGVSSPRDPWERGVRCPNAPRRVKARTAGGGGAAPATRVGRGRPVVTVMQAAGLEGFPPGAFDNDTGH